MITSTNGSASMKIIGSLNQRIDSREKSEKIENEKIMTPVRLGDAITTIETKYGLDLRRDSVLVLVNGIEANALQDLDTIINDKDEVVVVPMFHGGAF